MSHYGQNAIEAASAEASKKYAVGMEGKYNEARSRVLELEDSLRAKEAECEKKKKDMDFAIAARNKLAAAYDQQKAQLLAKCAEVETLVTKVAAHEDVNRDLKASEYAAKEEAVRLKGYYESKEYTDKIISDFRGSEDYDDAIISASYAYLQQGQAHMARQLHYYFKDKAPLVNAYELFFAKKEARAGADFVPFSEAELKEIRAMDEEEGQEPWIPPPPSVPNFFDLLNRTLPSDLLEELEQSPVAEGAEVPAVEVPATTVEPVIEGTSTQVATSAEMLPPTPPS